MFKLLPTGVDDFQKMVANGYIFIDHTLMIREFVEEGDEVSLILRPRRWGKSLTLSMLYYFLAAHAEGTETLFDKLKISEVQDGQFLKKHRGKYPVILLSLKGLKNDTYEGFLGDVAVHIQRLYGRHYYLLGSDKLSAADKKTFQSYLDITTQEESMLASSLAKLSELLHRHFGEKTYILIDEYDAPMTFVYKNAEALEKTTNFLKKMLGDALKSNPDLNKGLMTGILRLSKNHMLSDLNNLKVYSSLNKKYSEYYGFLEEEVDELFKKCELTQDAAKIKHWYNGYYSGTRVVYNPWSIINCLSEQGELKPYWVATGSDDLIKDCLIKAETPVKQKFLQLLEDGKIDAILEQTIKFTEVAESNNENDLWTLLFYAGYLKATDVTPTDVNYQCKLEIPNEEVKCTYRSIFNQWLSIHTGYDRYRSLLASLTDGNVQKFVKELNEFLIRATSVRDFIDENSYHCFALGVLSGMAHTHKIDSNKEYGLGFLDVSLTPFDKDKHLGIILEFKYLKSKETDPLLRSAKLKKSAEAALNQVEARAYKNVFAGSHQTHVREAINIGIAFLRKSAAAAYKKINLADSREMDSGFLETAGPEEED